MRSGAARRAKRDAKKQAAKEERGNQKYKNQKGGVPQKSKKKGRGFPRRDEEAEEAEDEMTVIRNGVPVTTGGAAQPKKKKRKRRDEDSDEEEEQVERFTPAEKKLRALHKRLRMVLALKASRKRGLELDTQQQERLRREPKLREEVARFERVVEHEAGQRRALEGGEDESKEEEAVAAASEEEEDETATGEAAAPVMAGAPLGRSGTADGEAATGGRLSLEQRRAKKRQKHLAKLESKQQRLDAGKKQSWRRARDA